MRKVLRLLAMVGLIFLTSILGAILLALGTGAARAGIISGTTVGGPGGAGVGVTTTVAPNNDNVAAMNANTIILGQLFTSIAPIDTVFAVTASTGTTEYLASIVTVNTTGVPWSDFHFQLIPTTANGLDFDFPDHDPVSSSTAFTSLVQGQDTIDWSGGSVGSPGVAVQSLSIDVPDVAGGTFTLRAVPTVPEPSTAVIVGSGLLSLFGYGWWRRNRANRVDD
jgi:hypothetical protein